MIFVIHRTCLNYTLHLHVIYIYINYIVLLLVYSCLV